MDVTAALSILPESYLPIDMDIVAISIQIHICSLAAYYYQEVHLHASLTHILYLLIHESYKSLVYMVPLVVVYTDLIQSRRHLHLHRSSSIYLHALDDDHSLYVHPEMQHQLNQLSSSEDQGMEVNSIVIGNDLFQQCCCCKERMLMSVLEIEVVVKMVIRQ